MSWLTLDVDISVQEIEQLFLLTFLELIFLL